LRKKRNSEFPMLRVTFVRQEKNNHEVKSFIDRWSSVADLVDVQTYSDPRATEFNGDFVCNQPWKRLSIYADGHVVPCCGGPGIVFHLGTVADGSLHGIWVGEKMKKFRKMLMEKKYPAACLACMGSLATLEDV